MSGNCYEPLLIKLDDDGAYVITTPNNGRPIWVKKTKCRKQEYKEFQFFKDSPHPQAFPTFIRAPPGLIYGSDFSLPYNTYKKMSS